ncbi:MAG: DNA methyltransferase [Mycobacteriaceae bacterium]
MRATDKPTRHPAKFTDAILDEAYRLLAMHFRIKYDHPSLYDPFAGTGKGVDFMSEHGFDAWGTELEAEWADQSERVQARDSIAYMAAWHCTGRAPVDLVFTSPVYGNRMADHHVARDACKACDGGTRPGMAAPCRKCGGSGLSRRNTYTHALGRPLTEGSAAGMQWGDEYRRFHTEAWALVYKVLKPGGYFLLNVKDHIRKGEQQQVCSWHISACRSLGFLLQDIVHVPVKGNRQGQNGSARVDEELLILYRKDPDA